MESFNKFEKQPRKGVFLSRKKPRDANENFAMISNIHFTSRTSASTIWESFGKIQWMNQKLQAKNGHFWPFWAFGGVFDPF